MWAFRVYRVWIRRASEKLAKTHKRAPESDPPRGPSAHARPRGASARCKECNIVVTGIN